jgi:hypothetical protein
VPVGRRIEGAGIHRDDFFQKASFTNAASVKEDSRRRAKVMAMPVRRLMMFGIAEPAETCPTVQVTDSAVTPSSDIAQWW